MKRKHIKTDVGLERFKWRGKWVLPCGHNVYEYSDVKKACMACINKEATK